MRAQQPSKPSPVKGDALAPFRGKQRQSRTYSTASWANASNSSLKSEGKSIVVTRFSHFVDELCYATNPFGGCCGCPKLDIRIVCLSLRSGYASVPVRTSVGGSIGLR